MSPVRAVKNLTELGFKLTAVYPSGLSAYTLPGTGFTMHLAAGREVTDERIAEARRRALAASIANVPVLEGSK